MALPRPTQLVRRAAGRALHVTAAGAGIAAGTAGLTAGLLAGPARTGGRAARAAADSAAGAVSAAASAAASTVTSAAASGTATGAAGLAREAAVAGVRIAGALATGSDPVADGRAARLLEAGRAMFEPPGARRSRRVWFSRGRAHVELAAPAVEGGPEVGRALRRQLQRLDGVEWAAVNEVLGRVLVTFDQRRVGVDDVIGVIAAVEQARGGTQVFPLKEEHPADLEPLVAAIATAAIDTVSIGVAYAGKYLPVPALSRHTTLALAFLDTQQWVKDGLRERIGTTGTDLVFTGASALLHALTQSPTVPTLNAIAAVQRAVEVGARREVWRRREPELCRPFPDEDSREPVAAPGERPGKLPPGPVEAYRSKLGPTSLGAAVGLLLLTRQPARSADLIKGLTPKAAVQGREAFAAVLDMRMCRRGVMPMDGSAYRRLDRIDTVVVDAAALCTGPPVVLEARAEADGWDEARVWTAAARLLGAGEPAPAEREEYRLGPAQEAPDLPGGEIRELRVLGERVGTVTVAGELDPHAEALLRAPAEAGLRLVLTDHAGAREIASVAEEVAPAGERLLDTVRRLQAGGHGVLVVSARDNAALMAADIAVAPVRAGRAPAWGADLVTGVGLEDACRIVAAAAASRANSERAVTAALTGNVLGGLLASVGGTRGGQRRATGPGKTIAGVMMLLGSVSAVRFDGQPPPAATVHTPWHALDADQVVRRLEERAREQEEPPAEPSVLRWVGQRVAALPAVDGPARYARTVVAELADPLTPVLGTGAAATAVLGDATDAVLVGSVMLGSALISGLQRWRAETTLESLLLEQEVTAHRETPDGGREDVPASALRMGDVLVVESGDVVPADARLLEALDLEVDESNLTGESLSVGKATEATPGADLAERSCMLFDGTTVVAGKGRAVVVAVGGATQAGRAAAAAGAAAPPAGVQARLGELTRSVLPLTLAGGGAVALLSLLWGRSLRDSVKSGVAIAVAAVPEGLPLVATIAQQAAARRLSRRGVVVRSARVLEALGRVDTVCFDKTGTLTENRLRVVRLVPLGPEAADGEQELLALAAASVGPDDDQSHETDRAVVEAATERDALPDADPDCALSFTAERGYAAALRSGHLVVKGAPEVVLARCVDAADARERVQQLAGDGLRVLAVADRTVDAPGDLGGFDLDDAAQELTLRGLVALADTVRASTADAIAQLVASGVRVLVATGDHPETASAIAAQAGIPDADRVVTGAQFAKASDAERTRMVRETAVFARLSPEQKVTLVAALRRAGATLAMTGDGVNDAAAIRLADVGVGVAGAESPAARSAADLVLTDVDLTRLVDAIAEGRAMWSRVREAVAVLVGGNAGEVAFTVLGTALGGRAPLGTRQLLLVNLLTDMFPALAVAVAAPRRRPPAEDADGPLAAHPLEEELRAGPQSGFTRAVQRMVLVRGAATTAGATGAWVAGRLTGPYGRASTMGLAALIATQLGQTAWAGRRSPLVLVTAAGSLAVLVGVVQTPGVSGFFGCTPLDPLSWGVVLGSAAMGTAGAELVPMAVAHLRARGGEGEPAGPGEVPEPDRALEPAADAAERPHLRALPGGSAGE